MKNLYIFFFMLFSTTTKAQTQYTLFVDSISNLMDIDVTYARNIKVRNRNIDVIELRKFQIDTSRQNFIKVSTQIQNSSIKKNYYFYENKLIKIEILNYQKSKAVFKLKLYFKDKQFIYSSHKQTSQINKLDIMNTADQLLDYVEFIKNQK